MGNVGLRASLQRLWPLARLRFLPVKLGPIVSRKPLPVTSLPVNGSTTLNLNGMSCPAKTPTSMVLNRQNGEKDEEIDRYR